MWEFVVIMRYFLGFHVRPLSYVVVVSVITCTRRHVAFGLTIRGKCERTNSFSVFHEENACNTYTILYYTILYYTKLVMLLDEATAEAVSIVCGGVRAISRSSPPRTPLINRRCNKFIFI